MSVKVVEPDYLENQCKLIKDRREKFLDLVESQAKAIDGFYETFHKIDEKGTRRVQDLVKDVCGKFNHLIETSSSLKHSDIMESPVFPDMMRRIEDVREQCGKCRLPLLEEASPDILKEKRWDCLHAEEKITNACHQNEMLEDVLVDRTTPEYWNIITSTLKGLRYSPHHFYVALANNDTEKTRTLISEERDVLKRATCRP